MFARPRTFASRAAVALARCQLVSLDAIAVSAVGSLAVLALLLMPVGVGFRLLPPAARALRLLSDRARSRAERWTGVRIAPPPLPADRSLKACKRSGAITADEGFWRDLAWAWLESVVGGLLVAVPLALIAYGAFGALVQPFVWRLIDDGNWYAFVPVRSTATMLAALVLGLAFMAAGLLAAPATLRLHTRVSRPLLSVPRGVRLARRVERLTDTRARALDTQAAELRRIGRDLHDGAQARLVALGMTLDRATRVLETDPARARELLLDVRLRPRGRCRTCATWCTASTRRSPPTGASATPSGHWGASDGSPRPRDARHAPSPHGAKGQVASPHDPSHRTPPSSSSRGDPHAHAPNTARSSTEIHQKRPDPRQLPRRARREPAPAPPPGTGRVHRVLRGGRGADERGEALRGPMRSSSS